jgi:hypothetical protein
MKIDFLTFLKGDFRVVRRSRRKRSGINIPSLHFGFNLAIAFSAPWTLYRNWF